MGNYEKLGLFLLGLTLTGVLLLLIWVYLIISNGG